MTELSICIPTFNRADILDETLKHLAQITEISLEVIVSDNASPDHTTDVAEKYKNNFSSFIYHRQSENIGALRNMRSALSRATSPLCYFLSDDDRIVPETFKKIARLFQEKPQVVAVFANHCEFNPTTGEEFPIFQNIQKNDMFTTGEQAKIFELFSDLWSPITRTEIRQRHCYYDDTTFGFWRDVENFLKHGSIATITDMAYKHAQTIPRMEYQLIEPWYHDHYRADFELFIAGLNIDYKAEGMSDYITKFMHERTVRLYMLGYRFSCEQEKYLLQRHYLLRAKCHGQISEEQLKEWEEKMILHCVLERIEAMLQESPHVTSLLFEKSPITDYIIKIKAKNRFSHLPEIKTFSTKDLINRDTNNNELLLVMEYSTLQEKKTQNRGYEFSIIDILNTLRVTSGNLDLKGE